MQHRSVSSSYRGNPSPPLPNFRGGTIYSRLEATTLSIDHHPKAGCGVAQKGGGKDPPLLPSPRPDTRVYVCPFELQQIWGRGRSVTAFPTLTATLFVHKPTGWSGGNKTIEGRPDPVLW